MLGVTLAPATGVAVADMVTTGAVPAWLSPMAPGRRF
jgi:glycine/D-amino acid oxidase-like deaminating enzyme